MLTKPDLLQKGEEDAWVKVLRGEVEPLRHGYFITKQPAPLELREELEYSVAREREQDFFSTEAPWNDLPKLLRNRVGVPNLTKELSKLLSQLIEEL